MRTFGIWFFGLIASGLLVGLIEAQFRPYSTDAGLVGFIAGMCAFACARLWLAPKRET